MRTPGRRSVGVALATLACTAVLVVALTTSLGGSTGPSRAAVSVNATERLAAGPYTMTITRATTAAGERADIGLTDQAGVSVAGKPVSALLAYEGSAPGHEHHDILVSRETRPGTYVLDLKEAVSGPWLLTVVIGDEARFAYLFNVP